MQRSLRIAFSQTNTLKAPWEAALENSGLRQQCRVSVVIPAFGKGAMTRRCVESVLGTTRRLDVEIIVVDDCSPPGSLDEIRSMAEVRYLMNEVNQGFIKSCNRGGREASGEVLVFLNNDTICLPGWIEPLVDCLENNSLCGLVGAKLIYPNGSLQEAGAVVWSSGEGHQVGRGRNSNEPEFRHVREVDYCSGACLAIRQREFLALNGFDTFFSPAYYEDTDLAFRIRQLGLKVLVQPASRIIHLEGATGGMDLNSGVKKHQAENRLKFLSRWRDVLESHFARGTTADLAIRRGKPRLLVVDTGIPRPDKDSGSVRMAALLECAVEAGFDVVLGTMRRNPGDEDSIRRLESRGIMVLSRPWWRNVPEYLSVHGAEIDAVMISRPNNWKQLHRQVRRFAPRAALVYDTIDLHCLRLERELEISPTKELKRRADRYRDLECMAASRSDLVYVVSSAEIQVLREMVPEANIRVLSNIHEPRKNVPGPNGREGLLFLGGFQHAPNLDAVMHFVHDVFPKVRERCPEAVFRVVGSDAPASLLELNIPGVEVVGYLEDIEPMLDRARVMVAPLRFGAGVKGKINTAMANGLPVVTSTLGAEGMGLVSGENCLIADNPEEVAIAIKRLMSDDATWSSIAKKAHAVIADRFSRKLALDEMLHLKEMVTKRFDR